MKRRNLCSTKKLMAVILAASMMMSSGVVALATVDDGHVSVYAMSGETVSEKEVSSAKDVYAKSDAYKGDATAEVDVKGNVSPESNEKVVGIDAYSSSDCFGSASDDSKKATTTVTVGGDVKATSGSGIDADSSAYSNSEGANASTEATTTVTVGGDVEATSGSGIDADSSAHTYSYSDGANATAKATTTVTVGGDVISTSEHGIQTNSNASGKDSTATTTVTVGGDVTSTSGRGIQTNSYASGKDSTATTTVTVGGDVSATGEDEAWGIQVGSSSNGDNATTTTTIDVDGSVVASSNHWAEGINVEGRSGTIDIDVGGNVIQSGEEGFAIGISDGEEAPTITVKVANNVTASNKAIEIYKNYEDSTVDLTVEGTIKGDEHSIVIGEETVADNLNITVWKVDTSNNRPIVETRTGYDDKKGESIYGTNKVTEKVEQSINYIIRVEKVETSGGNLVADKKTARAGEEVYLEVTIPEDYEIDSFFNADGAANVDVISSGGKYYLKVPAGGGVDVGVKLKKISKPDPTPATSTSSDNSKKHESDETTGTTGLQNWSVGNYSDANAAATMQAIQGLQVHALNFGGADMVQNVADVLTPVDTITALNNFSANNVSTMGINNIMGAGVVDFKSMFLTAATDTVDVPVAASVAEGQSYTVMFSDGTSVVVQCLANGVLNIPFNKNAEGLTYIIYGLQMDPSMFLGMPVTSEWTY